MTPPRSSRPAARPGNRSTTAGAVGAVGVVGVLALGVVAAAAALAVLLAFWTLGLPSWRVLSSGAPAEASDLLLVVLCAAGVVTTLWLGCGLVLSVFGALPGAAGASAAAVAQRLAPAAVRRGAALLVGAVIAATALPAAHAADAPPAPTTTSWGASAPTSDGGGPSATALVPLPDPGFSDTGGGDPSQTGQATVPAPPAPAPQARTSPAPARPAPAGPSSLGPLGQARPVTGDRHTSVTVVRGDSLWAIAARHLGPEVSNAEIAREWPRWYAANRAVIGGDPDLILVGQVLIAPAATTNGASR